MRVGAWLRGAPLAACKVWALDAPTPLIRRLGRMHEVRTASRFPSKEIRYGMCRKERQL